MRDIEEDCKWWEPIIRQPGDEFYDSCESPDGGESPYNDWLCDHLGDAKDVMNALWAEVERLKQTAKAYFEELEKVILEREALRAEAERLTAIWTRMEQHAREWGEEVSDWHQYDYEAAQWDLSKDMLTILGAPPVVDRMPVSDE